MYSVRLSGYGHSHANVFMRVWLLLATIALYQLPMSGFPPVFTKEKKNWQNWQTGKMTDSVRQIAFLYRYRPGLPMIPTHN
ncbi:hypothetical protein K504DRAFT_457479 [Pleomassaria siparia CBS 279.74]|uniref:Uncharacterized protein n=1 Tax=Pleomassaria siparia CBS 279.74 TaxID=1314801 RepID=A0A6G1KS43_9PLEO|nr:hypothetical protein K504DRAFT_457479 [Pleomassaria siparia CBS 279.74]